MSDWEEALSCAPIPTGYSLMAWEEGQSPLMKSVDGRKLEDAVDTSWVRDTRLSGHLAAEGSRRGLSLLGPIGTH